MEILISIGSFVLALFITALSIKLAAGWLDAEHNSWGRCVGALIITYVVGAVAAGVGLVVAGLLENIVGLVLVIVTVIVAIGAPIFIFARLLGTSGLRAFGILVIAGVVNLAILCGIVFVLAMVLGIGVVGLGSLFGQDAMVSGMEADDLLQSPQHGQVTTFTIGPCLGRLDPEDLEAYSEMQAESGIPAEQLCNEIEEPLPAADLAPGPCLAQLQPDERIAFGEMEVESGIPAEQLCRELMEDFDTAPAVESAPDPAPATAVTAISPDNYYALRDIAIDDAAAHIGKLVRVTLTNGSRLRDQLVAFDGSSATLKRDKSEGGSRYAVPVSDIVRLEVFDN